MNNIKKIDRQLLLENILILLLFIGGANLFILIKTSGVDTPDISFSTRRNLTVLSAHIRVTEAGLLVGIFVLLYENYIHSRFTKNFSFIMQRVIWHLDVALIIILPNLLIYIVSEKIESQVSLWQAIKVSLEFLSSGLFLSFFIYYYLLSILVSFFRRLHKTFGQHIFYNYLIGKYTQPKEENRVFMFVDMNDSTQLAEQLGHVKYSRLLNRCFDDILASLESFKYEIYQFVGDEIVFTWLCKSDTNGQALAMSRALVDKLNSQSSRYKSQFGVVPKFKSAVSSGIVSATLVGDKSKNIAYHGDVLNTTARLLGFCKKYKQDILFTELYYQQITNTNIAPILIDKIKLRGKDNVSAIYAIS